MIAIGEVLAEKAKDDAEKYGKLKTLWDDAKLETFCKLAQAHGWEGKIYWSTC